jgi:hypothetical protein
MGGGESMKSDLQLHIMCTGCQKIDWGQLCRIYLEPTKQWGIFKSCPWHPNTIKRVAERIQGSPGFVDPLKASKRKAKGK